MTITHLVTFVLFGLERKFSPGTKTESTTVFPPSLWNLLKPTINKNLGIVTTLFYLLRC